jgi:DNA relaxase NicK
VRIDVECVYRRLGQILTPCRIGDQLIGITNEKFGLHSKGVETPVHIDYISFTWCPKELKTYKKLFDLKKKAGFYQTFAEYAKAELEQSQVDLLDAEVRRNLLDFLTYSSKSFFWSAEEVADAWDEVFTVWERPHGMFGYKYSWCLYVNGQQVGIAAAGAKNGGIYLSFSGLGMSLLDPVRLHDAIMNLPSIKLTRADIALDDFEGVYPVKRIEEMYINREFATQGKYPKCGDNRSGGELKDGKIKFLGGETFYVGSRASGKIFRSYEKGKQQGDKQSPWVRHELEIRSTQRDLPLWLLLRPMEVFAGGYKCLTLVNEFTTESKTVHALKILCKKKQLKTTYDRALNNLKRVGGSMINVMRNARGLSDEQIIAQIIRPESDIPKAFRELGCSIEPPQFDHRKITEKGNHYVSRHSR